MNYEDYVKQMSQKHKIAVAIAVLRSKPQNISVEQYVNHLREKLGDNNFDDIISSDDFNDEDFNLEPSNTVNDALTEIDSISVNLLENFSQKEIIMASGCELNEGTSYTNVLRTLRDIDDSMGQEATINATQMTFCDQSQSVLATNLIESNDKEQNMMVCDNSLIDLTEEHSSDLITIRNDKVYSKMIATIAKNVNRNITGDSNATETNNYMDVNIQSVGNMSQFNDEPNVININTTQDSIKELTFIDKAQKVAKNLEKDKLITEMSITKPTVIEKKICNIDKAADVTNIADTNNNTQRDVFLDSQETIAYTVPRFTQDTSQISQSQYPNIEILKSFIVGSKNRNTSNENIKPDNAIPSHSQNSIITAKDSNKIEFIIDKDGKKYAVLQQIEINNIPLNHNQINGNLNSNTSSECVIEHIGTYLEENSMDFGQNFNDIRPLDDPLQNVDIFDEDSYPCELNTITFDKTHNQHKTIVEDNIKNLERNRETVTNRPNTEKNNREVEDKLISENRQKTTTISQDMNSALKPSFESTETELLDDVEAIPFKIVKELSRVKAYLERRTNTDGYSTDSGYRSDSQHSSYKNANTSESWLQQSAHCLYDYITQCPLIATTQDIVTEISLALGGLVDKLHEDENYPVFLEELLTTVDGLLKDIYEGCQDGENILLEKDERIQRLFLLNKSAHITQFSLDKIVTILQEIYTQLTSKQNLIELQNIQEIENTSYIFYILEVLLKKHLELKNISSQTTQNSQKVLKKSSISDIWRKKWNYSKETKIEGSSEKVCVLRKCGEVLNKIIVDCMEGYSLVAFSALQCFNLLQNS